MRVFWDVEEMRLITIEELKEEYEDIARVGGTEAECFKDYLTNCTSKNGTLEEVIK